MRPIRANNRVNDEDIINKEMMRSSLRGCFCVIRIICVVINVVVNACTDVEVVNVGGQCVRNDGLQRCD